MKTTTRLFLASVFLLLLAGCCIMRPFACYAYYEWLDGKGAALIAMENFWPFGGQTEERRFKDWMECGGMADGNYGIGSYLPNGQMRTFDEQYRKELSRWYNAIKGCMEKKGYQYVPECLYMDDSRCERPPAPNGSWPDWVGISRHQESIKNEIRELEEQDKEQFWPLGGQTEEKRFKDWRECRGESAFQNFLMDASLANKKEANNIRKEARVLWDAIQLCMEKKRYQYVPECLYLDKSRCKPRPPAPNGSWPDWVEKPRLQKNIRNIRELEKQDLEKQIHAP